MRVDIVDFGWRQSRLLDRQIHSRRCTLAFGMGLGNVMGIRCSTVTSEFADRFRASRLRVLLRLQNHYTCTLAQYESIAFRIKRTGRALRLVVTEG